MNSKICLYASGLEAQIRNLESLLSWDGAEIHNSSADPLRWSWRSPYKQGGDYVEDDVWEFINTSAQYLDKISQVTAPKPELRIMVIEEYSQNEKPHGYSIERKLIESLASYELSLEIDVVPALTS